MLIHARTRSILLWSRLWSWNPWGTSILVYRYTGIPVPVYWYTGIPVYRYTGLPVYRSTGLPVYWSTGLPVYPVRPRRARSATCSELKRLGLTSPPDELIQIIVFTFDLLHIILIAAGWAQPPDELRAHSATIL